MKNQKTSRIANIGKDIFTVVQLNLCVICDEAILDERGCNGAFELYEEASVLKYWLVEPNDEVVFIYVLNESEQYIGLRPAAEIVQSAIFPDLCIDLVEVFN